MGSGDCCWIISTMIGVDFKLRNRQRGAKDTLGISPYTPYTGLTRSCPQLVLKLVTLVVSPWELILPKLARSPVDSGMMPLRRITG